MPGNFDKPFGSGCSADGYSVGHTNGFTWPQGEPVYEQKDASSPLVLQASIGYEWHGDVNEWYPTGTGDHLIPLDQSRNTYRISGHLGDPAQRAFVVIEDL